VSSVTAIVPTHNRATTLGRALASIYAQTRVPDEVLVVDDASTDGTAAVVAKHPGALHLRLERNVGAGAARNAGIRRARGEWLAFLDSDDAWAPGKLEAQLAAADLHPPADLVCTGITVSEHGGWRGDFGFDGVSPDEGWTFSEFQNYPFAPSSWLVRRSVFETTGYFDEQLPNCEDLDLLARMSGRHRMRMLAEPLVLKHNLADSRDASLERTAASHEILMARHPGLWARSPQARVASCVRLATMCMDAGQTDRARSFLWRAIRAQPASGQAWALLAGTLLGRRNYQRTWYRVARPRPVRGG
jgi:glycosyltransferase involved in cell wall biosynthesis